MFRRNRTYDIDFLLEQDVHDERPNLEKLERIGIKDKTLAFSLFATQKDIPKEVQDYYLKKAKTVFEQDNKKYSHLLENMEVKNYNLENNNLGNNT